MISSIQRSLPVHGIEGQYYPLPLHSNPASTIQPADGKVDITPQFRPKLEHPALPPIRIQGKMEANAGKQATFFDKDVKIDFAAIDRLSDEKEAAIRDFIAKEKSRKTWGVLATVFQYLCTATSIFIGIGCLATGNIIPGVLLISGATLGLGTQIASQLGLYEKFAAWLSKSIETQAKISRFLEITSTSLSLMAGFAGGFWAYGAGALSGGAFLNKLAEGFQAGTSLLSAGARLKEGYLQKQIAETQIKMKDLADTADLYSQDIEETTLCGRKLMENLHQAGLSLKNIIHSCGKAASE